MGVRCVQAADGTRSVPATLRTNLAEPPSRVVIWGMAVPAAGKAWTLYVFQPGGRESGRGNGGDEIPLPPGGRRLASIRGGEGGSITAFVAADDLGSAARQFFDRWFAEHGWTATVAWRQTSAGWQARFESSPPGPTAGRHSPGHRFAGQIGPG